MGKVAAHIGRVSRPGHRFTASRRLHTANRKAIAEHNRRIGEVLHAFNAAQAAFFIVLWHVATEHDFDLAYALWEGQSSELAQRKLLQAFVEHQVRRLAIRRALLWALAAMNQLAEMRNDAVHADFEWHYDQIEPGLGTKRTRRDRLLHRPFERIWHALRGDLAAIANYVNALAWDVSSDAVWPSTKRPKLALVKVRMKRR